MLTALPPVAQKTADERQEPQPVTSNVLHEPSLPPQVAACLGERLRTYYAQLMKDPLPDNLLQILEPLKQKGRVRDGD